MTKLKITIFLTAFLFLLSFSGCQSLSTKSTSKGTFKSFDLKSKLPEGLSDISPENTKDFSQEISVGEPSEKVIVRWKNYQKENDYYIVSVTVEVPRDLNGTELTGAIVGDPINKGTQEKVVQTNQILIQWDSSKISSTVTGTSSANIAATGEFTQNF